MDGQFPTGNPVAGRLLAPPLEDLPEAPLLLECLLMMKSLFVVPVSATRSLFSWRTDVGDRVWKIQVMYCLESEQKRGQGLVY